MPTPAKKTLVLGASDNPQRYSYLAMNRLRSNGHPVTAIGRKRVKVGDIEIETLYLSVPLQKQYYDYILGLQPKRIIFNPGTENPELEQLAHAHGIEPVAACTLVLLSTGQY